ncbi:MAG: SemiSWEET transporter [Candidatus Pacearchaeota archaeon]|nr:SemiSWEET transporter [Candidatus Pacearchaeota archaeon]
MDWITILGLFAAFGTTIAFLPQAIKSIKSKKTNDVSLGMYSVYVIGIFLWLSYGILIKNLPIILANAITFILTLIVLVLKLKYK